MQRLRLLRSGMSLGCSRPDRALALVIATDDGLRSFISEALFSFRPGFWVCSAADAGRAREWIHRFTPSLVVGAEDCRALFSEPGFQGPPPKLILIGRSGIDAENSESAGVIRLPARPDLLMLLGAVRELAQLPPPQQQRPAITKDRRLA